MKNTSGLRKWAVLALVFLGTALLNYSNIIFAARAADIMQAYACNAVELALIVSVSALPGAFLSIPFGRWIDIRGSRKIMLLCLVSAAIACFLRVAAKSYTQLLIYTVLIGIFLVPTGVVPAKVLSRWFDEKHIPLAMGIYASSAGCGSALAYATCMLFPSVKAPLSIVASAAAVLALLWLMFKEEAATEDAPEGKSQTQRESKSVILQLLRRKNLWCLMLCGFISCGVLVTVNTYLSRALCVMGGEQGAAAASIIGSVMNVCMIIGGACVGLLLTKLQLFNVPFLLLNALGGGLLLSAWYLPFGAATYICFPLAMLLISGAVGLNMSRVPLLTRLGDYSFAEIATANGLCNTMMSLGGFSLPVLIAKIAGERYPLVFLLCFVLFLASGVIGMQVPELSEGKRP